MPSSAGVVGVDDHVDSVAEHVEVRVGDQRRDLDQGVLAQIEPGHLAVDPHQVIYHSGSLTRLGSVIVRPRRGTAASSPGTVSSASRMPSDSVTSSTW